MPMHQTLLFFAAAVVLSGIAAAFAERLRADLRHPLFWAWLLAAGSLGSAASAVFESTRHAGTGLTTSHGWPKPFYFRYLSETGARSDGLDALYFAGNALFFAGGLLLLWTTVRAIASAIDR